MFVLRLSDQIQNVPKSPCVHKSDIFETNDSGIRVTFLLW